jgi:hypothetical protein
VLAVEPEAESGVFPRPRLEGRPFWGRVLGMRLGRLAAGVAAASLVAGLGYLVVGHYAINPGTSGDNVREALNRSVDADEEFYLVGEPDLRLLPFLASRPRILPEGPAARELLARRLDEGGEVSVLVPAETSAEWIAWSRERLELEERLEYRGRELALLETD